LFDPQIPQPLAILAVSTSPIAGWPPCGLPLPGIGDVVVDLVPPNPVLLLDAQVLPVNPPFGFATLPLPNDLQLLGVRLYAQGFFFDASPGAAEPLRLTNGLRVTIGL
jgi:hypothetical protein